MSEPLFSLPTHAQLCPKCQHALVIRQGKHGPFLGCSQYPNCDYLQSLHPHDSAIVKVLTEPPCPRCGQALAVKNGRFGMFIGCTAYPSCDFIVHEDVPVVADVTCPKCHQGKLVQRTSKFGKPFYGCDNFPRCDFIVNFKPIPGQCQQCHFPLLLEKPTAAGHKVICADKRCGAEQDPT